MEQNQSQKASEQQENSNISSKEPTQVNANNTVTQQSAVNSSKLGEFVAPINRSGWAVAAGYVAFLNLLFFFAFITAPITIFFAWKASKDITANPTKKGKGRVYFAYTMSFLSLALFVVIVLF